MNNVKIIYYNIETINSDAIENMVATNQKTISHYIIKPGLILVNFRGSAQNLYNDLIDYVRERSVFIHDLDSGTDSYYGFMNKSIWEWLRNNRS